MSHVFVMLTHFQFNSGSAGESEKDKKVGTTSDGRNRKTHKHTQTQTHVHTKKMSLSSSSVGVTPQPHWHLRAFSSVARFPDQNGRKITLSKRWQEYREYIRQSDGCRPSEDNDRWMTPTTRRGRNWGQKWSRGRDSSYRLFESAKKPNGESSVVSSLTLV